MVGQAVGMDRKATNNVGDGDSDDRDRMEKTTTNDRKNKPTVGRRQRTSTQPSMSSGPFRPIFWLSVRLFSNCSHLQPFRSATALVVAAFLPLSTNRPLSGQSTVGPLFWLRSVAWPLCSVTIGVVVRSLMSDSSLRPSFFGIGVVFPAVWPVISASSPFWPSVVERPLSCQPLFSCFRCCPTTPVTAWSPFKSRYDHCLAISTAPSMFFVIVLSLVRC